jgi:cysteine desulfurase / selenocysteine lyase
MLYLDNAATSFPKAPGVSEAMVHFLTEVGASAGRGGHRLARKASDILWETRELVSKLLGFEEPGRVVFCLNVTQALNMALFGILRENDHVVTSSMEHNSVMRPLRHLELTRGIQISQAPCTSDGLLDPREIISLVTDRTRLIVITHASNVTGGLMPVREVAQGKGNALLLLDAAQTAGAVPIHMDALGVDILAFTGHKALLGPPGVGGLCVGPNVEIPPLVHGGTGTVSESHDHPTELPLALEAGTHNMVGVAGLRQSLSYLLERGVGDIVEHERRLTRLLMEGLRDVKGLELYGPTDPLQRVAVISVNFKGVHPSHLDSILDQGYGILVRAGLHCAPSAHRTLGTFPEGTVRISMGPFQGQEEVKKVIEAFSDISRQINP